MFVLSCFFNDTAPPKWTGEPHNVVVTAGERVHIQCEASGYPEPNIVWTKKGTLAFFYALLKIGVTKGLSDH